MYEIKVKENEIVYISNDMHLFITIGKNKYS